MKKFITLALAVVTAMSCSMVALASQQQTVLTTTVPETTYTLEIPASQEVAYGSESMILGEVKVSESAGFLLGKKLKLTIEKTEFTMVDGSDVLFNDYLFFFTDSERKDADLFMGAGANNTSKVEYTFIPSGEGVLEEYVMKTNNNTGEKVALPYLGFDVNLDDWVKAKPGKYEMSFTFETEIIYD